MVSKFAYFKLKQASDLGEAWEQGYLKQWTVTGIPLRNSHLTFLRIAPFPCSVRDLIIEDLEGGNSLGIRPSCVYSYGAMPQLQLFSLSLTVSYSFFVSILLMSFLQILATYNDIYIAIG